MPPNVKNSRKERTRRYIIRTIGMMTAASGMIVAAGILSLGSTLQQFLEKDRARERLARMSEAPAQLSSTSAPKLPEPARPARFKKVASEPSVFSANPREPFARLLNGKPVVKIAETEPDTLGNLTRVTIIRTRLKYPLIRIEDRIQKDEGTNEEKLLSRTAMVADHLMLSLGPEMTEEDLARFVNSLNQESGDARYEIRRTNPNSKVFLLAFEGASPEALERAREKIRSAGIASAVEPDYLVQNR